MLFSANEKIIWKDDHLSCWNHVNELTLSRSEKDNFLPPACFQYRNLAGFMYIGILPNADTGGGKAGFISRQRGNGKGISPRILFTGRQNYKKSVLLAVTPPLSALSCVAIATCVRINQIMMTEGELMAAGMRVRIWGRNWYLHISMDTRTFETGTVARATLIRKVSWATPR